MRKAIKILIYAIVGVIAIKIIILIIGLIFAYKTYNKIQIEREDEKKAIMKAMEEATKKEKIQDSIWQQQHQQ